MTDQTNTGEDKVGPGATGPRNPLALETAVQALLVRHAPHQVAHETAYADAAIDLAFYRGQRTDEAAMALAKSAEHLLCDLDDRSMSNFAEYAQVQKAVQPYVC